MLQCANKQTQMASVTAEYNSWLMCVSLPHPEKEGISLWAETPQGAVRQNDLKAQQLLGT